MVQLISIDIKIHQWLKLKSKTGPQVSLHWEMGKIWQIQGRIQNTLFLKG